MEAYRKKKKSYSESMMNDDESNVYSNPYQSKATNYTEKDKKKVDAAYSKQSKKDEREKVYLGEEYMLTGNTMFDVGLALGRKRKNKKG